MKTAIHNFVSVIVKMILLGLALELSAPVANKTQYLLHLCLNSTLKLIISSDLQKLLKQFNGTAISAFLKIPLTPSA